MKGAMKLVFLSPVLFLETEYLTGNQTKFSKAKTSLGKNPYIWQSQV